MSEAIQPSVRKPLSILYVAYPLLPVTESSAGGAEQMLLVLEREMAARGHRTTTAACAGSRLAGAVVTTGTAPEEPDRYDGREVEHNTHTVEHAAYCAAAGMAYDLVHDKSGSFWRDAAAVDAPVLATLHLPRSFYRAELFVDLAPNIFFNCVSQAQAHTFADLAPMTGRMLGVVPNGIEVERFLFRPEKRDYLLWVGRMCEEKGADVAIEVAARTELPLVLAGQVYPFSYHQKYFERMVRPHIGQPGSQVTWVDTPSFAQKLELLRHARALLVPSLAEETSSLIAMEAMACGTPVIAFRRGGIPEVVAHGETGLIVDTSDQMAEAVKQISGIDRQACRARVAQRFSARRMTDDYERLYGRVIESWRSERIAA